MDNARESWYEVMLLRKSLGTRTAGRISFFVNSLKVVHSFCDRTGLWAKPGSVGIRV